MSVYKERWQNAVRWANEVNRALAEGLVVFVGEGADRREISAPLVILEGMIFGP